MRNTRLSVYASLCDLCGHLSSRHGLAPEGDFRLGPYCCRDCSCKVPQDGPDTPLTAREYREWAQEHPELTWEGGP